MSVNMMNFQQAAQVLNGLVQQATGQASLAPVDLSQYISVGQKALRTGYDPLAIGISEMVGRTIFTYRPYTSALSILRRTDEEYGAVTRKISAIHQPYEDESVYDLTDGQHPDMFEVRKPKLWQANFYGFDIWSDHISITRQQLKNAVTNPADLGRLMDLVLGTKSNEMENGRETFERATLANLIGALNAMGNTNQVRHLLTEYNAATGQSLTSVTVYAPDNYGSFIKWAYAQIAQASDMLTEYTSAFHLNPTEGNIMRHTPKADQRIFVYNKNLHDIGARVLADTFNSSMVSEEVPYTASLNFFQALTTPDSVNVTPAYINASGAQVTAEAQQVNNIFAVIADRDALGTNYHDQSVDVSPYEARGKYYNYWYHEARRYFVDVTENSILFLLD